MSDPNALSLHTAADEAMAALEPVFKGQLPSDVTMPSGRTVYVGADPDMIRVEYFEGTSLESENRFLASYTARLGSTVMKTSVVVKDSTGRRNTDFHAARLLRRGLEHFDTTNRKPVDTFHAMWISDQGAKYHSDNHETYSRILAADPESGPAAQARAARETWTGKQMAAMGFVWITRIKSKEDGSVDVIFKRPSVMSGPVSWINRLRSKRYEP
jgi:hypothetical protein